MGRTKHNNKPIRTWRRRGVNYKSKVMREIIRETWQLGTTKDAGTDRDRDRQNTVSVLLQYLGLPDFKVVKMPKTHRRPFLFFISRIKAL